MSKQGSKPYDQDVRLRAVQLVCRDQWKPSQVAKALGCSVRSVQLWVQKSSRGRRPTALATVKPPGATSRLSKQQKRRLLKLLAAGPEAAGYVGQLWTCPRIAKLIVREFGVSYHTRYLPTLLKSLGWSVQTPQPQALERDEATIAAWVAQEWPRIKKNPGGSEQRLFSRTKPGS